MTPHRISLLSIVALTSAGCTVAVRPAYAPPPPPAVAVTVGTPPPPAEPAPPAAEEPPPPEAPATEPAADTYDDQDPTALQDFHPALDAHGRWVDDPAYGTIWVPNPGEVGPDFVPYMGAGHWVYGDDDYLWVSDYDWGWAPFHYGRWVPLSSGGWGWIPGREYAPAWVEWRVGDDYVGWAPARPAYIWRGGVVVTVGFVAPEPRYAFVAHADLFSPTPGRVVIRGERAEAIRGRTHPYAEGGGAHGHRGPPPSSMKIPPSRIVHATGHERGAEQARNFGHPSTAQRMGAHPPAKRVASAGPGARPGRAEARPGEEHREPGKTTEREPGRTGTEREPGRTGTEREPGKTTERGSGKTTEREPGRTSERDPAKTSDRDPSRTTESARTPEREPGRTPTDDSSRAQAGSNESKGQTAEPSRGQTAPEGSRTGASPQSRPQTTAKPASAPAKSAPKKK